MVGPAEIARRLHGLATGRLSTLPILALNVHSACNCRCVMCDIWKANADKRELSPGELADHVEAIRRLHVQRVMLTGGEPLLHSNLWALCDQLRQAGVRITLVTTGLLIEPHAAAIARSVDTVVISLDGPSEIHDRIRRVKGGFEKIVRGVIALRAQTPVPRLIARSVVQQENYARLDQTIAAARRVGFDELSFLAADVSSTAFNRPEGWPADRQAEVAVPAGALDAFAHAIETARAAEATSFASGFVVGGVKSLDRIHRYYCAVAGVATFPEVWCTAPWVSAVLEPGGTLRPCFFHEPYDPSDGALDTALNSASAVAFRRNLDVASDPTCQRCVCSLNLHVGQTV
jgi:MoaA/NifB/PqqE/SkfB family radical SAM enzyme